MQVLRRLDYGADSATIADLARGGCNRFAFACAICNKFVGFTIALALFKAFASMELLRKRWTILGTDVGKYSHAAFLVHVPVLVGVQSGVNEEGWSGWSAYTKAAHVGVIGIIESWLFGWLLKESADRIGFQGYL